MSTVKKSKLDLLVRVRYANPLPPPPCPPKLLEIPTNPMRYAEPAFLDTLASNAPLPMIVDAECGMPLDLAHWECLWQEDMDDSALNPDPNNLPKLDPQDEILAYDTAASTFANGHGAGTSASVAPTQPAAVSWLRRTEYTSRADGVARSGAEQRHAMEAPTIDVSRPAQLRDIDASFAAANEGFSLENLRHPNKPNVTAVESYEVLPDVDIWSNQYDLFRFSERPGDRAVDEDDPRLDCAILRPMKGEHETFLSYYLAQDDESAVTLKTARSAVLPYEVPENEEATVFKFIRDYETVKVEQEVPSEFLLTIDDGSLGFESGSPRSKGAYYKSIERKMTLKKRRQAGNEDYEDKWEVIRLSHTPMVQEEQDEREDLLAEVNDPQYLLRMAMADGEADAEGEVVMEDDSFMPTVAV